MASNIARMAVIYSPDDPYRGWQKEFLAQTGLVATPVELDSLGSLEEFDVALFMGRGQVDAGQKIILRSWYRKGKRSIICVGSSWGISDLLGVEPKGEFSKATSVPLDGVVHSSGKFLFVGGERATATDAEQLAGSPDGFTTVSRCHEAWFVAPEPGRTICLFGLGRSVGNDRVGPTDGSVVTEDGCTRSEDGCNLDWDDREDFSGAKYHLTPHIDCMRDAFVRVVVAAVESIELRCAILWHWPDNAQAASLCTVEWDTGQAELVKRLAATLARFGIAATWLAPSPGQPQEAYRLLRSLGHEFGLLYKHEGGDLKSEQIRVQYISMGRLTGSRAMASCRGIDGYWHGLTVIYEAIEGAGGQVSVAKGGSKPGTAGFLFGTTRPFFPISRSGRSIPVLEVPYIINQPGLVTPAEVAVELAMRAHRLSGCVHFTVRPSNVTESAFDEALDQLLVTLRHNRMQTFLPERLYEFERGRRAIRTVNKGDSVSLGVDRPLTGITLMVSGTHVASSSGRKFAPAYVKRYGTHFTCATLDLEPRVPMSVNFAPAEQAA